MKGTARQRSTQRREAAISVPASGNRQRRRRFRRCISFLSLLLLGCNWGWILTVLVLVWLDSAVGFPVAVLFVFKPAPNKLCLIWYLESASEPCLGAASGFRKTRGFGPVLLLDSRGRWDGERRALGRRFPNPDALHTSHLKRHNPSVPPANFPVQPSVPPADFCREVVIIGVLTRTTGTVSACHRWYPYRGSGTSSLWAAVLQRRGLSLAAVALEGEWERFCP